jgi:hypothetical protein
VKHIGGVRARSCRGREGKGGAGEWEEGSGLILMGAGMGWEVSRLLGVKACGGEMLRTLFIYAVVLICALEVFLFGVVPFYNDYRLSYSSSREGF